MKLWRRAMLLIVIFCSETTAGNITGQGLYELYVLMHVHTTYSDGANDPFENMKEAVKRGYDGIIFTDHFDLVVKKCGSLKKYIELMESIDPPYTKYGKPLIVGVGLEIAAKTAKGKCHLLALNPPVDLPYIDMQPIDQVLATLKEYKVIIVAAHPNLDKYFFPKEYLSQVDGIEFFNDKSMDIKLAMRIDGYNETLKSYLKLNETQNVFATAGCDSHFFSDLQWTRATIVFTKSHTKEGIFAGLLSGLSYASQYHAKISGFNYEPGFEPFRSCNPIELGFIIDFPRRVIESKTLTIYRGEKGIYSESSLIGRKQLIFSYKDKDATSLGMRTYVMTMRDFLVTCPIRFQVEPEESFQN